MNLDNRYRLTSTEFFIAFSALAGVLLMGEWFLSFLAKCIPQQFISNVWLQAVICIPFEMTLMYIIVLRLRDVKWHGSVAVPVFLAIILIHFRVFDITISGSVLMEMGALLYSVVLIQLLFIMPTRS